MEETPQPFASPTPGPSSRASSGIIDLQSTPGPMAGFSGIPQHTISIPQYLSEISTGEER